MTDRVPAALPSEADRSLTAPQGDRLRGDQSAAEASRGGWGGKLLAVIGVLVSLAYLANPGWGAIELLPDYIPGVGNLDEVLFSVVLVASLQKLGINILPFLRSGPLREAAGGKR